MLTEIDKSKGWQLNDLSDKILVISTPNGPLADCPFGGRLPKVNKRWTMWTFPPTYPMDLPQRKCVKVSDGEEEIIEKQPVDWTPAFNGQIGYITGMEIHCDSFREPTPQSKYYFLHKHTPKGVEVYVFERGVDNVHHMYQYRSARAARVEMKRCRIPEYAFYRTKRK